LWRRIVSQKSLVSWGQKLPSAHVDPEVIDVEKKFSGMAE